MCAWKYGLQGSEETLLRSACGGPGPRGGRAGRRPGHHLSSAHAEARRGGTGGPGRHHGQEAVPQPQVRVGRPRAGGGAGRAGGQGPAPAHPEDLQVGAGPGWAHRSVSLGFCFRLSDGCRGPASCLRACKGWSRSWQALDAAPGCQVGRDTRPPACGCTALGTAVRPLHLDRGGVPELQ